MFKLCKTLSLSYDGQVIRRVITGNEYDKFKRFSTNTQDNYEEIEMSSSIMTDYPWNDYKMKFSKIGTLIVIACFLTSSENVK